MKLERSLRLLIAVCCLGGGPGLGTALGQEPDPAAEPPATQEDATGGTGGAPASTDESADAGAGTAPAEGTGAPAEASGSPAAEEPAPAPPDSAGPVEPAPETGRADAEDNPPEPVRPPPAGNPKAKNTAPPSNPRPRPQAPPVPPVRGGQAANGAAAQQGQQPPPAARGGRPGQNGGPAADPDGGMGAAGQAEAPAGQGGEKILPRSPEFKFERVDISPGEIDVLEFIRFLSDYTGLPVFIDSTNQAIQQQKILIAKDIKNATGEMVIALLQANRLLVTRQVLPSGEEILNVVSQQGAIQGPEEPKENPLIRVDGSKVERFKELLTSEVTTVRPDEIATMVFTLRYTQPADAIQSLNNLIGGAKAPAKTQAFSIVDVKNSMLVIITAKFGLLNYLAKLLSIIDVPIKEPERIIQIIDIENADAEEMVQLIQTFLQGRGTGTRLNRGGPIAAPGAAPQPGQIAGGARSGSNDLQTNLIADWRTQKIIVETYSERDLEDIHMLVRELDARFDIRRLKTRIYQVRYLKADEVAADLQTLIGGAGGGLSGRGGLGTRGGAGAGGAGAGGARRGRTGGLPRIGGNRGAQPGIPTPGVPGAQGGGANAPMPALIVPHVQTNSLIIQAEPEEYAELLNILEQIDVKRRQVFLEAALVEVTTGSQLNYTIELLAGEPNDTATRALFESSFGLSGIDFEQFNRTIPDLSSPQSVPPGALMAIMSRGKFPALVRFFKTNTDTQVLATPFILADDNQPNTIDIIETRYVQNTNTTGTGGVTTTTNEGEDAGITLDITPTISSQSAVFLEMTLEVSQFQQGGTAQVLPPKTTNTVTSAVTIPDGEIFVIGGLTRENKAKAVSKVPLLGDIPLLGKLFRSETSSRSLSNLYIFLRAHILTHPNFDDGVHLTQQALQKVEAFAPGLNPSGFKRPDVAMPPDKARDPDQQGRFYIRQRSKYPEGREAPRNVYEPVPPLKAQSAPATYENDPDLPVEARGGVGGPAPRPTQPVPLTRPAPEVPAPAVPPVTTAPPPAVPGPAPSVTPGSETPDGGEGSDTPLPPLTSPPTSTEERDVRNPAALDGTGLEVDPDGSSWLVPLRERK